MKWCKHCLGAFSSVNDDARFYCTNTRHDDSLMVDLTVEEIKMLLKHFNCSDCDLLEWRKPIVDKLKDAIVTQALD